MKSENKIYSDVIKYLNDLGNGTETRSSKSPDFEEIK